MTRSRSATTLRAALVLAVLLVPCVPAAATAQAATPTQLHAAHAVERYYASYGSPRPIPPPPAPAPPVAPRPRPPVARQPRPPVAPAAQRGPGWDAAVGAGVALAFIAAGLGVLAGRDSMRPRRT
jgi:hypothetical protein